MPKILWYHYIVLNINDRATVSLWMTIYIYYMVVSVTLGFMLHAFIRQSERFSKQDQLIWLIFLFWWCWKGDFVCVYLNVSVFMYVLLYICTYKGMHLYIYTFISAVCWWEGMKERKRV